MVFGKNVSDAFAKEYSVLDQELFIDVVLKVFNCNKIFHLKSFFKKKHSNDQKVFQKS